MTQQTIGTGRVLGILDIDQKRVVTHTLMPDQHLHVVAGAGSGKTRCMAMRVGYLIEAGIDPTKICAISFSKKSGRELGDRIQSIHRAGYKVQASTYHSLGFRWLRAWDIAHDLIENRQAIKLVADAYKEVLPDTPDDGPHPYFPVDPKWIFHKVKDLKQEGKTGRGIMRALHDMLVGGVKVGPELVRIWKKFETKKKERKVCSFLDMIYRFWLELHTNSARLAQVQATIDYLLVDEVQDLSHLQYAICELLSPTCQVMTVGDPRQSIYGFRGASLERMEECLTMLSPTRDVLTRNYRSGASLVALGNLIVRGSEEAKASGESKSVRAINGVVEVWRPRHEYDEGEQVTKAIEQLIARKVDPKEICVLYRNNSLALALETTLTSAGIPNVVVGGMRFAERAEVRTMLAFLKLAHDPADIEAASRTYRVPARGIGGKTWSRVRAAHRSGDWVYEVMRKVAREDGELKDPARAALRRYADQLEQLASYSSWSPARVIDHVLHAIEGNNKKNVFHHYNHASDEDNQEAENLLSLRSFCAQYRSLSQVIELLENFGQDGGEQDAVRLMTIHKSKGLEFEHVFVAGVTSAILKPGDDENRRVLYVAATRAKNGLVLSAPKTQYGQGTSCAVWLESVLEHLGVDLEEEERAA